MCCNQNRQDLVRDYEEYMQVLFKAWLLLVRNLSKDNYNPSVVENVVSYLAANCDRNISLSEIANKFSYHAYHINRMFKYKFGTTLKQYHIELRIKKAMQILTYSNHSIYDISNICGYEDVNYFSRIFKHRTSFSPLKYRNHKC